MKILKHCSAIAISLILTISIFAANQRTDLEIPFVFTPAETELYLKLNTDFETIYEDHNNTVGADKVDATHSGLIDMPSSTNTDHDDRYYTQDEVNELVAGASFDFFLNNTDSNIATYFVMDTNITGDDESSFSDTITDDAFLIDSFATTTNEPTFTELIIGVYAFHTHANTTTGANVGTARLYFELYKRTSGGTETLLITSEESDILNGTKTSYEVHGSLTSETVLATTDRLVLKVYANIETSRPSDPVVTFYAEGTLATRFEVKTTISAFDDRYVELLGDTMTGDLGVPDDAYDTDWNASVAVATKNAIYDKIEALDAGDVSASASITDHSVVRGDGGVKNIQGSGIYIDDNNNFGVGTNTWGTSATNVVGIAAGGAPGDSPANMIQLYATDTIDGNVVILMHYNGSDASTTMTDEAGHTFTARNSAQLDTADKKFGTASLITESDTEDYIDTPDNADWNMAAADYTVECWINTAQTADAILCGQASSGGSGIAFYLRINNTANKIEFHINDGSGHTVTSSTSINDSAWHHVAGVRYNNEMKLYIGGVSEGTPISGLGTIPNRTTAFSIGRVGEFDGVYYDGWIDEFRLSDTARYITNFSVATTEFRGESAELNVMDELENVTTLSSHPFDEIPEEKTDEYFYPFMIKHKSKILGRGAKFDIEGIARALENLTGKKFVYEERIPIKENVPIEKIRKMPKWMQKIRQEELVKREEEKILDKIAKELARIIEEDQPDTGVIQ